MCPKCGSMFPTRLWKSMKSIHGVFYYCPECKTKHHWNELKLVRPKDV